MGKKIDCAKVSPESCCRHVVRGNSRKELLFNAGKHAREHGVTELTPELLERINTFIEGDDAGE